MDNKLFKELINDLQKRTDRISLRLSESIRMKDELDCIITVTLLEEYAKGIRQTELLTARDTRSLGTLLRISQRYVRRPAMLMMWMPSSRK